MNLSMWSQDVYDSAGLDEHGAEQLPPFECHPTRAKSKHILEKVCEMNETPLERFYHSSGEPHPSPAAEWNGHQAKRARVENIIRGMTSSPVREMKPDLVQRAQVSQKQYLLETLPEERPPMWNGLPDTSSGLNNFSLKREKVMADVLKYELSKAVSNSVDSIFKSMPLIQVLQKDTAESSLNAQKQSLACNEVRVLDVQTEALSLVVQRPQVEGFHHFRSKVRGPSHNAAQHEQESDKTGNAVHRNTKGGSSEFESRQAKLDALRKSVKIQSQVQSRSSRRPLTHVSAVETTLLGRVCFPRVKIESSGLLKSHLYILNEGLTTNHLKKAKLMFFYARYPSSLVLKTCFRDVQFTRCVASQLIKWFSNFREFYYIQMERFARRAVAADARALSVGRESQLFRALNVHYNKGGDFQVPNGFLEVAEITLREFYTAISAGKDRDPSWKKAIYKVICKLDADVPAQFKTYG